MECKKRLIDANAFFDKLEKLAELMRQGEIGEIDLSLLIASTPTVDAVEVVHGHWITLYKVDTWMRTSQIDCFICSECGVSSKHKGNYCPNCGAKMDGGKDDEDQTNTV